MNLLGLQSWYSPNILTEGTMNMTQILTVGIMSSIFMLVVAVILLITAIMFISRFVLLIFIMILSPLALIAYIIPGMRGQFDKWWHALVDQSFFAPIFFALTWVSFKIATSSQNFLGTLAAGDWTRIVTQSTNTAVGGAPTPVALIFNYTIVTGFAIAALVISKQMASKTAGFKAISGGIGTVAIGGTAWLGRKTVGNAGKSISENASLQRAAKEKTGFSGAAARFALSASKGAGSATFDARNAAIPTGLVGSTIEGTLGRTKFGKKLGLNDVGIPSVPINKFVSDMDILGKGGTKGYKEIREEKDKRIHDRDAKAASELALAEAKEAVNVGAKAPLGSPAIDAMEKALSKLSTKETEALVASNGELLDSQNFANSISVQQLEAINKSDQFSEAEKSRLKSNRFKEIEAINDPAGLAALAVPVGVRTPAQVADAARVETARTRVKGLSDSELEMINPNYLDPARPEGREFISQLKGSQADAIISNKGGKFTTTQKENVKRERMRPLIDALIAGRATDAQTIVRKADIKTKVSYMKVDGPGTPPIKIALDSNVLPIYTVKMLQRMALHDDMSDQDIHDLRMAILGPTGSVPLE